MDIFEKNIVALETHYDVLFSQGLKKLQADKVAERVGVRKSSVGTELLMLVKDHRIWNLNSRLDPETAADIYAEACQIKKFGVYLIFGFLDGRHIRHILKKCDSTNRLIICIPDIEVFYATCCVFDLADLIEEQRILFYVPEIGHRIKKVLKEIIDYTNSRLVDFFILPGQDALYPKLCEEFIEQTIDIMRDIIIMKSTYEAFDRKIPQNTLFHMKNMIHHSNHEQLRKVLEQAGATKLPVIIVSAGPSLDKNIHTLKLAEGKAFIVVVDAALRTVIRAGIRPDMVCTVDPNVPERFYEGIDLSQIIWSCTYTTKPWILKNYGKKAFYYGYFCKYWSNELKEELGYNFPDIVSGGSVSIEAFMLARYLGFEKVILIGQDLAFTGGVSHTKGVGDVLGKNDEYIKSRYLMQVEGIDGSILDTDFQMWYYKQWFEKVIKRHADEIEVIDATEGGALIQGTKICTLQEAIQAECKAAIDIYKLALQISPAFSQEQKKKMFEKLGELKSLVEQFEQRITHNIKEQKRILKIASSGFTDQKMIQELTWILQQSEELKQDIVMDMVISYARKEEYEFGEHIYDEEDMSIETLVQQSIKLFEGYQKGCKLLLEDIEEFIIKDI